MNFTETPSRPLEQLLLQTFTHQKTIVFSVDRKNKIRSRFKCSHIDHKYYDPNKLIVVKDDIGWRNMRIYITENQKDLLRNLKDSRQELH